MRNGIRGGIDRVASDTPGGLNEDIVHNHSYYYAWSQAMYIPSEKGSVESTKRWTISEWESAGYAWLT